MPVYTDPIYDRTAADVSARTAKAFINVVDWIRIYNNSKVIQELVNALLELDITFDEVALPSVTTIPTVAQLNTILANIERVRAAAGLPVIDGLTEIFTDWGDGWQVDSPDYMDVNQWEKTIAYIRLYIVLDVEYMIYCGVAAAGQPRFYQHRWRIFQGYVPDSVAPVRRARTNAAVTGTGLKRQNGYRRYD